MRTDAHAKRDRNSGGTTRTHVPATIFMLAG
jgi:hypothetical protein